MGGGCFPLCSVDSSDVACEALPPPPPSTHLVQSSTGHTQQHVQAYLGLPRPAGAGEGVGGQELASAGRRSLVTRGGWQQWLVLQLLRRTLLKYPPTWRSEYI